MGCWTEYCVVCAGPPNVPCREDFYDEKCIQKDDEFDAVNLPDFEWLISFVGINESEELIALGEYIHHYGCFDLADGTGEFGGATYVLNSGEEEFNLFGLICHEKCYRLLQRDLSYTLRFDDVWPLLEDQGYRSHLHEYSDYGGIKPYLDQYFLFRKCFVDGKQWMLQDPMTHRDNAERILKVWRPFVESKFKLKVLEEYEQNQGASEGVDVDPQTASQADVEMEENLENLSRPNVGDNSHNTQTASDQAMDES